MLCQRSMPRQLSKGNRPIVLTLFLMLLVAKDIWRNTGVDPAQNLTYDQDRAGGGLGVKPPEKFLGTTPFLSSETPLVP